MTEGYFEQKNIYYRTNEFKPDAPTLVFVHGVSGSSSAWLAYEESFGKSYNILSFDLRGHGKSRKYETYKDYAFPNFVQDLRDLLNHLGIKKCTLISHSFGTLIALDYLLQHPETVASAVFMSPNFSIKQRALAAVIKPVSRIAGMIDVLIRSPKDGGHTDYSKYPNSGDWNIPRMIADTRNTGMKAYLHCTRQSCDFDRLDLLDRIAVPVLVIHGKKDTIFPVNNSIEMVKRIKGAKLVLLDNAQHAAQQVVMGEAARAIVEFLSENQPTSQN
jgi:3-oxoadipate enol-lactonase